MFYLVPVKRVELSLESFESLVSGPMSSKSYLNDQNQHEQKAFSYFEKLLIAIIIVSYFEPEGPSSLLNSGGLSLD